MKVVKLETPGGNKSPEQVVFIGDVKIVFQSYNSIICEYDKNTMKLEVFKDWDYSRTTMRYLWQFLQEYTPYRISSKKEFLDYVSKHDLVTLNLDK